MSLNMVAIPSQPRKILILMYYPAPASVKLAQGFLIKIKQGGKPDMPSEKILAAKQQRVEEIAESFKGAVTFVFASTRGLTVAQDTKMRAELREAGVKFEIIKNTTLIRVFEKLGYEGLEDTFKGPTAVAFSDEITAPAKILAKYAEEYEPMELKGGIIDGKVASLDEIIALSKVPDQETLHTQYRAYRSR